MIEHTAVIEGKARWNFIFTIVDQNKQIVNILTLDYLLASGFGNGVDGDAGLKRGTLLGLYLLQSIALNHLSSKGFNSTDRTQSQTREPRSPNSQSWEGK